MRLETALRRHLLAQPSITSLVQQRVWKYALGEKIDQSGKAGVLIRIGSGWAGPDRVQTIRYPRVVVDAVADPTRDAYGMPVGNNATDRAYALAEEIVRLLTYPNMRGVEIGAAGDREGVTVVSSQLYIEPRSITASDYHTAAEQKTIGDVITVRAEFAMETFGG